MPKSRSCACKDQPLGETEVKEECRKKKGSVLWCKSSAAAAQRGNLSVASSSRSSTSEKVSHCLVPEPLLEAVREVTETVLTNPGFFAAANRDEVRHWVRRLFPDIRSEVFDRVFRQVIVDPDVPWGKRRFAVLNGFVKSSE